MQDEHEVGFIELLRVNPTFRKYWCANAISMLGEWFNTIALFVLIDEMSGSSELALGMLFMLRMFALAFPQLLTGVLADRYSRKWLMVLANLLSALAVSTLLFVDTTNEDHIWFVYAIAAILMGLHAMYIPAENAAMPNITKPNELLTANALNSATWSASLAIGSALGGFVVAAHGVEIAFIIDVIAFVIAGLAISTMNIPQTIKVEDEGSFMASSMGQLKDGMSIIWKTPRIRRVITAKALWGLFGGGLVYMLVLLGAEVELGELAAGIGIMFAARGAGTFLGPVLARYVFTNRSRWPFLLGWLVSICGLGYALVGFFEWQMWFILLIVAAHAASGVNWVLSTVLLQERSEDEWRGRMFSTDFMLMTTVNGISTLAASMILEYTEMTLAEVVQIFALGQIISGVVWVMLVSPGERRFAEATSS
ncbi:MAG: MFS transporter [Candidatus Thalassarchaeaceae archaeon]|nr:MFS transporter [Candidatus Thalassarchaeaceae archaeon]